MRKLIQKSRPKLKVYILTAVFTLLFCYTLFNVKAKAATDIRVGLKALYMGKDIITIYTPDLKMGYCKDDVFKPDIELKSTGGFSFEPENRVYYSDYNDFESYGKAVSELSKKLSSDPKSKGMVCYAGRKKWLVYLKDPSDKTGMNKVSSSELIKLSFGQRTILIDGSVSGGYPQFAPAGKEKSISLGTRKYRGRIEIGRYGSVSLSAINIVNIESYLLGVVSCEMNSTWHSEAQKAQAVAARSYCLANTGFSADSYLKKGYVIVDTDESQVYGGINKETEISRYAVKATMKLVLKCGGKIVPAYFFSTSGGATEFSSDIWGGNSSVFIGVFDEYETNPERAPWIVKTTFSELENKLKGKGYNVSTITDIYPEIVSDSGRVSSIRIKYKGGSISVKGSLIKSLYGMHSTKFKIITNESEDYSVWAKTDDKLKEIETSDIYVISGTGKVSKLSDNTDQMIAISSDNMTNFPIDHPDDREIWFLGMGWGHGIGMSQSGAYGLALKGYGYKDILMYYYNDTQISSY